MFTCYLAILLFCRMELSVLWSNVMESESGSGSGWVGMSTRRKEDRGAEKISRWTDIGGDKTIGRSVDG